MTNLSVIDWMGVASQFATVAGIAIAIAVFLNEKRKERLEREYGAYHSLDEKYIDYLNLCLRHPELDVYFRPLKPAPRLTPEQEIQQSAILEILICLLERAFLLYRNQSSQVRRAQWEGWDEYIRDWCQRENFRHLWPTLGEQFDQGFLDYVNERMRAADGHKQTAAGTESVPSAHAAPMNRAPRD